MKKLEKTFIYFETSLLWALNHSFDEFRNFQTLENSSKTQIRVPQIETPGSDSEPKKG